MERKKNSSKDEKKGRERGRKGPKPATPERLEKGALHYLERFASSSENLRRVLMRRVQRSAYLHGTDVDAGARAVEDLIARFRRSGLLDDGLYAEGRAASLHRQGKSQRAIRQALSVKGIDAATADSALTALDERVDGDVDLGAAVNYARRRRIGPWRREDLREAARDKDMAALARQGFGYDTARKVIEADTVEALEIMLEEAVRE
ncbi:RecX family transcriptional regulator [Rhodospirillaceae bacterium KN72]|uniref:Regulatory protein RecX n=1 Tax=Pacificispira spongiicola TaxID=2729598 RepID=A0A7Y0HFX5_9PROT|nr:RecX family transcriptional regulator [Pacificispira spongiicola]NMM43749.1 RecX family transcriptional regulator [Pacificispira spongiicola]